MRLITPFPSESQKPINFYSKPSLPSFGNHRTRHHKTCVPGCIFKCLGYSTICTVPRLPASAQIRALGCLYFRVEEEESLFQKGIPPTLKRVKNKSKTNCHLNLYSSHFPAIDVEQPVFWVWGAFPHNHQILFQHNARTTHFCCCRRTDDVSHI